MKRILFCLLLCLMLVGCGNKKPSGISDEMYDSAVYVLKTVDLYLDGSEELKETTDKISGLNIPMYSDILDDDAEVYTDILGIKITLSAIKPSIGTQTISDLKEGRDRLAKRINYK